MLRLCSLGLVERATSWRSSAPLPAWKETPLMGYKNEVKILRILALFLPLAEGVQLPLGGNSFIQSPEMKGSLLSRWQQIATFPASFPTDFLWKPAEKIVKWWSRGAWQLVVSRDCVPTDCQAPRLQTSWPWSGEVIFCNDQKCFTGHKAPFPRPL